MPDDIVSRLQTAAGTARTVLRALGRRCGHAARHAWGMSGAWLGRRLRSLGATRMGAAALDPLIEEEALLPGTSDRAFRIGLVVVSLSMISALATYLILSNLTPISPSNDVVLSVLLVNAALVAAMLGVIVAQGAGLWRAWKRKVAGARLHVRIVALFSLIAALPALFLTLAATSTFSRALDSWFDERTISVVQGATDVAKAYLLEHGPIIRTDAVNMARDLDEAAPMVGGDVRKFRTLMVAQAALRDLPLAYIVDSTGAEKLAVLENQRIPFVRPSEAVMREADSGRVPLYMPTKSAGLDDPHIPYGELPAQLEHDAMLGRVAAVIKLRAYPGSYLYVARGIDMSVVRNLRQLKNSVAAFNELKQKRSGQVLAHALMYSMISLTALFAAIWIGLWFAGLFVAPIRRLINAAQEVTRGNLKVELPIRRGEGDLRRLSVNFNAMTKELESQRTELVTANRQLSERRRFMEAVLSGVSAGVIGLDRDGNVTLVSRSAEKLLACDGADLIGRPLADVVPEFGDLVQQALDPAKSRRQQQIALIINGEERSFSVRLTEQAPSDEEAGSVVTFDDITELVSAQRTSAWTDVARRIAHEIKNPLTPIQLSAERLRRKYAPHITEDRETFDRCTETIIRQVGDVTRMVDEFSAFARSPKPQMEDHDIRDIVKAAVIDRQMASQDIVFDTKVGTEPIIVTCDRRLISQAVINLVKNAQEAIQSYAESKDREPGWAGRIETSLRRNGNRVDIEVIDNGPGLPKQHRTRLTEPYVTTKGAKGTGLGLAIVQKSVEQHAGVLILEDPPPAPGRTHGALVRINLPAHPPQPLVRQEARRAAIVGGEA
ncbi:MAG TPA: PAS domain-containing sensor histidine kinase [Hyphomicrobiaceae bacterium]|nr:PAS domain-containing sensor histidine kinase [Hyphomicrobiaceae bacterium]